MPSTSACSTSCRSTRCWTSPTSARWARTCCSAAISTLRPTARPTSRATRTRRWPPTTPGANALPVDFLRPYQGFGNISLHRTGLQLELSFAADVAQPPLQEGAAAGRHTTPGARRSAPRRKDLPGINGFGAPRIDTNNRLANYGPQDFDRRHNFNVNWVYELPKATRSHGARPRRSTTGSFRASIATRPARRTTSGSRFRASRATA